MKKEYYVESLNDDCSAQPLDTLKEAIGSLSNVLCGESNYNYQINKDNTYCVSVYDVDEDSWDSSKSISISEFKNMEYDEKENFFKEIETMLK